MAKKKSGTFTGKAAASTASYRRHIALHPGNGLAIAALGAFFFFLAGLIVALSVVLVVELLVLLWLPRLRPLRRAIDRERMERRRREAVEERTALVAQLSEPHRRELADLERIALSLRSRVDLPESDDLFGVDELVSLYVRLALVHREALASLERVGHGVVDEQVARFRAFVLADGEGASQPRDESTHRGLRLLRLRCEARARAANDLRAIESDLTSIGDALRWMAEHCATAGVELARNDLAAQLANVETNISTMRELCALRTESAFGTDAILLGRTDEEPPAPQLGPPASSVRPMSARPTRIAANASEDDLLCDRTGELTTEGFVALALRRI